MTFLKRADILRHRPPRFEDVPVPEMASEQDPKPMARIQALTATAVDWFLGSLYVEGPDGKTRYNRQDYSAKLLTLAWVDEKGQLVFQESDVVALGAQDSAMVQRLAIVAERLSGLQAKQPETEAKN